MRICLSAADQSTCCVSCAVNLVNLAGMTTNAHKVDSPVGPVAMELEIRDEGQTSSELVRRAGPCDLLTWLRHCHLPPSVWRHTTWGHATVLSVNSSYQQQQPVCAQLTPRQLGGRPALMLAQAHAGPRKEPTGPFVPRTMRIHPRRSIPWEAARRRDAKRHGPPA